MIPNRTAQADVATGFTAEVIDFAAHKARRHAHVAAQRHVVRQGLIRNA
jgi:hypothetical protein